LRDDVGMTNGLGQMKVQNGHAKSKPDRSGTTPALMGWEKANALPAAIIDFRPEWKTL